MKKNILSALAICAALLGCQKNEISEPSFSGVDLHATIEDDASTKTLMDEDNNIRWSEGDQIVAFMKTSYGYKYQVKPSFIGETYADFSKVSSSNGDDLSAGMEWDHIVAYYPYAESIKCAKSGNNYALNVILPSEQTYAAESFGNGFFPMVAVSENNNITFRNILGGMKLQLKGTQKVKSIKLEGKNNETLSGTAVVTAYTDETKPTITMASSASVSVTLNCGAGVQLNENTATEFIIALPPMVFSKGFTVTVNDSEGKEHTIATDKENVVLRSSLLVMPEMKIEAAPAFTPTDYYLTATYKATDQYKTIWLYTNEIAGNSNPCVYIDYGDGTLGESGEHTYENAGDYTVKFYFENPIIEISRSAFYGITGFMKSVTIPETVKKISDTAFMGQSVDYQSSLAEVIFEGDSQLEIIGNRAFAFNSSLKTISLPASVNEIGSAVFYCCKNLESIGVSSTQDVFETFQGKFLLGRDGQKSILLATICNLSSIGDGSGHVTMNGWLDTTVKMGCFSFCDMVELYWSYITSIESNCFEWCDNLERIGLDRTVTIGDNVFRYCKSLRHIVLPAASSIGCNTFCQNESLESIELACGDLKEINTLGNDCASLKEIRIPSGVTSISSSFNNDPSIEVVYVSALTPPSLYDSFDSISQDAVIYVPCTSLETYKSAQGWSSFSDQLIPYDFENGYVCGGESHYIDEYGIDHGHGVKIGETVWAPVNCGYHATDFKYGKLYQWGRKYGQGYEGKLYDINGKAAGDYSDATVPTIEEGGVSVIIGQHKNKENVFFTSTSEFYYDWLYPQDSNLWNSGTDSYPVKTENDPCPEGWRVPTNAELDELNNNYSSWTTDDNGRRGIWFSGQSSYTASVPQVFFPAAGGRSGYDGNAYNRGYTGVYWSSRPTSSTAYYLGFCGSDVNMECDHRAYGFSVRCVQE